MQYATPGTEAEYTGTRRRCVLIDDLPPPWVPTNTSLWGQVSAYVRYDLCPVLMWRRLIPGLLRVRPVLIWSCFGDPQGVIVAEEDVITGGYPFFEGPLRAFSVFGFRFAALRNQRQRNCKLRPTGTSAALAWLSSTSLRALRDNLWRDTSVLGSFALDSGVVCDDQS
eukprot:2901596-Rhodomonas_salina.2